MDSLRINIFYFFIVYAIRKKLNKSGKIYVLIGDGECQEGTTWESSLIANHHKLDNLIVIVDYNKKSGKGKKWE